MLTALSTYHAGNPQMVIVGDPAAADTAALNEVLGRVYLPTALVVPVAPAHRDALARVLPWTAADDRARGTRHGVRVPRLRLPDTGGVGRGVRGAAQGMGPRWGKHHKWTHDGHLD